MLPSHVAEHHHIWFEIERIHGRRSSQQPNIVLVVDFTVGLFHGTSDGSMAVCGNSRYGDFFSGDVFYVIRGGSIFISMATLDTLVLALKTGLRLVVLCTLCVLGV